MRDFEIFEEVARLLERQEYQYAKTMPKNPHWYTLRKTWEGEDAELWSSCVRYIQDNGVNRKFQGWGYVELDVNEYSYWTMGAGEHWTELINRKPRATLSTYDKVEGVGEAYDEMFSTPEALAEDSELMAMLGDLSGASVLDIGCGTGLLLKHHRPGKYLGIDPSLKMLEQLRKQWPEAATLNTDLMSFAGERYDVVLALFAGLYLSDEELLRIPSLLKPGGRYVVMFTQYYYRPVTHEALGISQYWRRGWSSKLLPGRFPRLASGAHQNLQRDLAAGEVALLLAGGR